MDPSLSLRVLEDIKYLAHPGIRTPFLQVRSPDSIRLRYPNCSYQSVSHRKKFISFLVTGKDTHISRRLHAIT